MLADVMCDAIIVERSKLEPEGKVTDGLICSSYSHGCVCLHVGPTHPITIPKNSHTYNICTSINGQVGTMQAVGYVARYVGNVLGATLGTVLYNKVRL